MAAIPPVVLRPAEPAERPFRYARRSPAAALDVARSYWSVEWSLPAGEHHDQDVVTHPSVHVTVEAGRAWIQGIVTERFTRRLVGSGRVVGVQLVPTGLSSMTSTPPASLTGRRVPAEELLGDVGGLVAAVDAAPDQASGMAAFEEWLVGRDPRRAEAAAVVDAAVALITEDRGLTRVDDVARALTSPCARCSAGSTATSASARSGSCNGAGSRTRSRSSRRAATWTGPTSPAGSASPTRRTSSRASPPSSACPQGGTRNGRNSRDKSRGSSLASRGMALGRAGSSARSR